MIVHRIIAINHKILQSYFSDNVVIKECGVITVTSNTLNAEDQTYPIDCGDGAEGNKVRVRLEDTDKPLEIAEISVLGYRKISELKTSCRKLKSSKRHDPKSSSQSRVR